VKQLHYAPSLHCTSPTDTLHQLAKFALTVN